MVKLARTPGGADPDFYVILHPNKHVALLLLQEFYCMLLYGSLELVVGAHGHPHHQRQAVDLVVL